jgi:hypothetical protein
MGNLVTSSQIEDGLRRLPPEKLGAVYDFVSYLLNREGANDPDSLQSMPAPEQVIRRDSDRLEDDASVWDRLEEETWGRDRLKEDLWEDF